jgi:MAF protein
MSPREIILGSGSPRRRELLQLLALPFQVILPTEEVDETPLPHELPTDLVQRLSRLKNEAVAATLASQGHFAHEVIILTADTTVALDTIILNKPQDDTEARQMLTSLREQPHRVYTSMTISRWQGQTLESATLLHTSNVWMRDYSAAEMEAYITSGEPFDKAGGYGIQHPTFAPVARFDGCFSSIMGLPLAQLATHLQALGFAIPPIQPHCQAYIHGTCCQVK